MRDKSNIATLFLRNFTKELIINSAVSSKGISEEKEKPGKEESEQPKLTQPIESSKQEFKVSRFGTIPVEQRSIRVQSPVAKPIKAPPRASTESRFQRQIEPIPETRFGFEKLSMFMRDPSITGIECQGPGKPLIIGKMGRKELTKITLTEKEIRGIIERFAEEARIPVIKGLFKAIIGDLMMTAVVSEIAGSRFIITRVAR